MRPSRGMGKITKAKKPGRKKRYADAVKVGKKNRPPKKPSPPRLGPPLKDFKPRRWPKELA